MTDFFIYTYEDKLSFREGSKTITVLFIPDRELRKSIISQGLEDYNRMNVLSDRFVVILPEYASENLIELFTTKLNTTFNRVVGFFNNEYSTNNYSVYTFNYLGNLNKKTGNLKGLKNKRQLFKNLFKNGNFHIFDSRGGLIQSSSDHHFVFPSGKHSESFIRTGNVLRDSNEVFFIAIQLLQKFDDIEIVYCDTASINVLPFAVFELRSRFGKTNLTKVKSFDSYKIFEDYNQQFHPNSIVLISSSTSGNIIDRLREKQITLNNSLLVLFFIGDLESYQKHSENILCDISKKPSLERGYGPVVTHSNSINCSLCKNHSQPVLIQSDVFLSIEPKYNIITLKKTDSPGFLSKFIESHKAININCNIFRVNYRDTNEEDTKYAVYIDFVQLLKNEKNPNYPQAYIDRLEKSINSHIPNNTRYLMPLRDPGSKALAEIISKKCSWFEKPKIVDIDNPELLKNISGTIVIVGATYVTGRHYFYINRLLRRYPKLSVVYFIGLARSKSKTISDNIKSNLGIGEFGTKTFPVIVVEEIFLPPTKSENPWNREFQFIRELLGETPESSALYKYFKNRHETLLNSQKEKGLTNNVFLKTSTGEDLKLRKGFVYWNFEVDPEIAFQSQVFFTITAVLNSLRNKPINSDRSLQQSTYVRNLVSAESFNRFNDGVIQASLLRASDNRMLAYDLDEEQSITMTVFLKSLIDKHNEDHGEALPEFLLAISLKKMRLKRVDLKDFIDYSLRKIDKNEFIYGFIEYMQKKLDI